MFEQAQVFVVTFCAVFLKGFQHKNVIGNHIRSVAATSYLMAVCDVAFISLVSTRGWSVCFSAGTGAAIGMVLSIKLHDRLVGRRSKDKTTVGSQLGEDNETCTH